MNNKVLWSLILLIFLVGCISTEKKQSDDKQTGSAVELLTKEEVEKYTLEVRGASKKEFGGLFDTCNLKKIKKENWKKLLSLGSTCVSEKKMERS